MVATNDLITLLEQLRIRLNNSGVERTAGIGLKMGQACDYYKKSMRLFNQRDLADIRSLLNKVMKNV